MFDDIKTIKHRMYHVIFQVSDIILFRIFQNPVESSTEEELKNKQEGQSAQVKVQILLCASLYFLVLARLFM